VVRGRNFVTSYLKLHPYQLSSGSFLCIYVYYKYIPSYINSLNSITLRYKIINCTHRNNSLIKKKYLILHVEHDDPCSEILVTEHTLPRIFGWRLIPTHSYVFPSKYLTVCIPAHIPEGERKWIKS